MSMAAVETRNRHFQENVTFTKMVDIIPDANVGELPATSHISSDYPDIMLPPEIKLNQIQNRDGLDISYNETISAEQYTEIGNYILNRKVKVTALHAIDCDITPDKLKHLSEGLEKGKLRQLDISWSKYLTAEGFTLLAKFVLKHKVETLIISSCELTKDNLCAFREQLMREANELKELDLSYNETLEPEAYEIISTICVNCGITFLNLAGCKVSAAHLDRLKFTQNTKIKIDTSDNVFLRSGGITRLSEIAKECPLQELDISDCMITTNQLRLFREGLKDTKICRLDLSDYDRRPEEEYITEVCRLLPYVTEVLYLEFKSLSMHCQRLLQDELNKLTKRNTKIISMERTIVWQKNKG